MYRAVDFMMKNGYWNAAHSFLLQLQDEKPERMIAALRFTSDVRDRIVGWSTMVRVTDANLRDAGRDAKHLLRGLLELTKP